MFYSTSLPKSPGSAAQARLFLDRVRDDVSPDVLEDARLLVSELVANAIEHVREDGEIELRVALSARRTARRGARPRAGLHAAAARRRTPTAAGACTSPTGSPSRWAVDRDGAPRVWFELSLNES